MLISEWSSDVCSSDLIHRLALRGVEIDHRLHELRSQRLDAAAAGFIFIFKAQDRRHHLRRELQRGVAGGVNRGLVGLPQLQARGFVAQLRAGVERVELRIEARDGLVAGADAQPLVQFRYALRSEEHTSELQSLMRISYAVF